MDARTRPRRGGPPTPLCVDPLVADQGTRGRGVTGRTGSVGSVAPGAYRSCVDRRLGSASGHQIGAVGARTRRPDLVGPSRRPGGQRPDSSVGGYEHRDVSGRYSADGPRHSLRCRARVGATHLGRSDDPADVLQVCGPAGVVSAWPAQPTRSLTHDGPVNRQSLRGRARGGGRDAGDYAARCACPEPVRGRPRRRERTARDLTPAPRAARPRG